MAFPYICQRSIRKNTLCKLVIAFLQILPYTYFSPFSPNIFQNSHKRMQYFLPLFAQTSRRMPGNSWILWDVAYKYMGPFVLLTGKWNEVSLNFRFHLSLCAHSTHRKWGEAHGKIFLGVDFIDKKFGVNILIFGDFLL